MNANSKVRVESEMKRTRPAQTDEQRFMPTNNEIERTANTQPGAPSAPVSQIPRNINGRYYRWGARHIL